MSQNKLPTQTLKRDKKGWYIQLPKKYAGKKFQFEETSHGFVLWPVENTGANK